MNLAPLLLALVLHPLHTTHTTLTVGPGGSCTLEIRAFTDDLDAALRQPSGAASDSLVARYVRSTVTLADRAGRRGALAWVGQARDGEVTRLRFTCTLPAGIDALTLRQAMQTELYSDQVNVVQVNMPGRRISLLFTPGDQAKPVT